MKKIFNNYKKTLNNYVSGLFCYFAYRRAPYLYFIYSIRDLTEFGIMEIPTETKKRHASP